MVRRYSAERYPLALALAAWMRLLVASRRALVRPE